MLRHYETFIRKLGNYELRRLWEDVTAPNETQASSVLWAIKAQALTEEMWRRGMLQCDFMDHDG